MFTKRIIPCLDVNNGRVVKGINFVNLRDAGDPVEVAAAYDKAGADEVVFLDITATSDARETVVDMVRKVAEKVFIFGTPLWGLLVTVLTLYGNGTPAQLWVIADFTTVFPTFVNVATLFLLSGTFIKLLKDYKARYMGIGEVDKDLALFYEDKKAKENK